MKKFHNIKKNIYVIIITILPYWLKYLIKKLIYIDVYIYSININLINIFDSINNNLVKNNLKNENIILCFYELILTRLDKNIII